MIINKNPMKPSGPNKSAKQITDKIHKIIHMKYLTKILGHNSLSGSYLENMITKRVVNRMAGALSIEIRLPSEAPSRKNTMHANGHVIKAIAGFFRPRYTKR